MNMYIMAFALFYIIVYGLTVGIGPMIKRLQCLWFNGSLRGFSMSFFGQVLERSWYLILFVLFYNLQLVVETFQALNLPV